MNASSGRHGRGFSLVELLVTVIIAGLFFAALVPVMVQAINTGSGDRMRVLAVNAAQDRIEKIRQLDFDLIVADDSDHTTLPNLYNPSFYFGQFGPTWTEQTAAGPRTFNVEYQVTPKLVNPPTDNRVAYKVVTITVDWTGRPAPVKKVVLTTLIYRQYAGPQIVAFDVGPYDSIHDWITSAEVDLTAVINGSDIPSMQPITVGASTLKGRVEFTITSASGTIYPKVTVWYDAAHPSTFTTKWNAPGGDGVADGYYNFRAVAYNANYYPGNTWQFSKRIESGPPTAVTNLAVHGIEHHDGVTLTWTGSVSGDLAQNGYEVYRDLGAVHELLATLDKTAVGYTDTSAKADLSYTYTVRAIDQVDRWSDATVPVTWMPLVTPPGPALNLQGAQGSPTAAAATLGWDPPTDATDVVGYEVYAAGNGTTPVATVSSGTATVAQGWNTSQWYQVKPFKLGRLLATSFASIKDGFPTQTVGSDPWVRVTVGAEPRYTLNVINDVQSNKTATITLSYLGPTGSDAPTQVGSPQTNVAYNGQATWSNLVSGWYRWHWKTSNNKEGERQALITGLPLIQTVKCTG